MLELRNIIKDYKTGDTKVRALDGISLKFRKSEFVSILGPSGCGKTTLLNIIGGLDQYTDGDLIINGISTKEYGDADWDTYRNHSIGFVFQSYNLIPHQTVLANVELALTLSGISPKERRRRAAQALEDVGLGDQLNKRPNQLSGGQMQRVAIARALVNDPEILLADEPTGALDTKTSVQIMDILREISHKKLIIMVTHNPELAKEYSSRIISLVDGRVVDDTNPLNTKTNNAIAPQKKRRKKKALPVYFDEDGNPINRKKKKSMSFFTALSLSLNNLLTKKGRTFMTSFAGSIGIIGIALILSVSTGVNNYINAVQRDTLASYPISLQASTTDLAALMEAMMNTTKDEETKNRDPNRVYETQVMEELMNTLNSSEPNTNDLKSFKKYLESTDAFDKYLTAIHYQYYFDWAILTKNTTGTVVKSDVMALLNALYGGNTSGGILGSTESSNSLFANSTNTMMSSFDVWQEMLPGKENELVSDLIKEEYDVIYGDWPQAANEIMLVVNQNNEISDLALYALGLRTEKEIVDALMAAAKGEEIEIGELQSWSYEDLCQMSFRMLLQTECYQKNAEGIYENYSKDDAKISYLYNNKDLGIDLKIVGILRPNADAASAILSGNIVYTSALTEYAIKKTEASPLIAEQFANPTVDVLTGLPFKTNDMTDAEKKQAVIDYVETLSIEEKVALAHVVYASFIPEDELATLIEMKRTLLGDQIENIVVQMLMAQLKFDEETVRSYISDPTIYATAENAVLTGLVMEDRQKEAAILFAQQTPEEVCAFMDDYMATKMTMDQYVLAYDEYIPKQVSDSTFDENLMLLGNVNLDFPGTINLYCATFEDKDAVESLIKAYNDTVDEEQKIEWTDFVALLMSSVTTIVNAITYVLVAFVAISLIVSSIMIGIITYISVLERTKEIGILRAIGASKKDISRVFNAETLIVGFVAGAIGILITLGLIVIINIILFNLTGIPNLQAFLPPVAAVILVAISMFLTFIAGLFPSGFAAKRNPVEALRSE